MNNAEKAVELFGQRFMCSQAVFAAFADEVGIPQALALKIGGCFGAGMMKAEVCGACTGALMALGAKYGHCDAADMESRANAGAKAAQFLDEFKKRKGSYICRDLLGCDISTAEGKACAREKGLFITVCPEMVRTAAEIVAEMLAEEG